MMNRFLILLAGVAMAMTGCQNQGDNPVTSASNAEGKEYVTTTEPPGATPVGEARRTAKDADAVVLVGRIGGSAKPFIDGLAAFTIVDPSIAFCAPEERCPTPWDYCCTQDQVKQNIAMVKFVDAQGKPVAKDARQLLGVKELNLVVVRGTAQRDDEGNLALLADQLYLKE